VILFVGEVDEEASPSEARFCLVGMARAGVSPRGGEFVCQGKGERRAMHRESRTGPRSQQLV
jgi:hypothetical protein